MITEKDKENIIATLRSVDVKKMQIDHPNERMKKWFRFGSYNGLLLAQEIIKQLPTDRQKKELTSKDT